MKQFTIINSDDGIIVEEVESRQCKYCNSAFIYKDVNGLWHLVDKNSGLSICYARTLKHLESKFIERKQRYEEFMNTDAYKIKVERFDKLILVYTYSKGVK